MWPSRRASCVLSAGFPSRERITVTAMASLRVEAAGKRARAFHEAPRPVRRSCTYTPAVPP